MNEFLHYDRIPVIGRTVLSRASGPKITIMNFDHSDSIFELDGMTVQIWESIDGKKNFRQILEGVKMKTPSQHHIRLQDDFQNFITQLLENQLISLKP